jgi:hypothetical protein
VSLRAALLAAAIALTGCPDKDDSPYRGPDADLLALVPDNAAMLLKLDLSALRESGVLRSGLKSGVRPPGIMRRIDAALLAAGARPERGGGLRFALVLRGRLDQKKLLASLSRDHALKPTRVGGSTFHGSADPTQPRMVFPPSRKGWLVVVSPGWTAPVAQLLAGKGRSALHARHLLRGDSIAHKGKVSPVGWSAARLSTKAASYLSSRVGWPELKRLRRLEGQAVVEQGKVLELGLSLKLDRAEAAKKLCQRLNDLTVPGLGPAALDCRARSRTATLAGRVRARALRALLSSVSKPLTRGGRSSTLGGHRGPGSAPTAAPGARKVP